MAQHVDGHSAGSARLALPDKLLSSCRFRYGLCPRMALVERVVECPARCESRSCLDTPGASRSASAPPSFPATEGRAQEQSSARAENIAEIPEPSDRPEIAGLSHETAEALQL